LKKAAKNFSPRAARLAREAPGKKFFGSFFQKRTASVRFAVIR
jgi:hypothetical protein